MENNAYFYDNASNAYEKQEQNDLKRKMKMVEAEEEEPLLLSMDAPKSTKGGFKTIPSILVNESFERVASYGLTPNMIMYLMKEYHVKVTTGNNIILYWSAATNFLPVVGAIVADSFTGRFWMIAIGCIFSLLGMILLWLTTIISQARPPPCQDSNTSCIPSTSFQLFILCSSFCLISLGAGGIRSSSVAFGANQLSPQPDESLPSTAALQHYFNWYTATSSLSVVIALTVIVYIQDNFGWQIGFGVPALLMFISALSFYLASPFYVKLKSKANLLTGFFRVIVALYQNRGLALPTEGENVVYHHKKESKIIVPSEKLRFLNKACIARDLQQDIPIDSINTNKSYTICTVDQVEEFKALIKVIPIWSTGVLLSINSSQPSLPLLQATSMDRHITSSFEFPAGSFGMLSVLFIVVWVALYDQIILPLASKFAGKTVRFTSKQRMGMGIFVSVLSMGVAAIVEGVRRDRATKQGYVSDSIETVQMSALWLVPQHALTGIADGLNIIGQYEFYYTEFPRSMSSIAMAINGVGLSVSNVLASFLLNGIDDLTSRGGKVSWISSNINEGHYDYYCWVLAGLGILNLMYYIACSWAYGPCKGQEVMTTEGDD